jgi:hypothetical protein
MLVKLYLHSPAWPGEDDLNTPDDRQIMEAGEKIAEIGRIGLVRTLAVGMGLAVNEVDCCLDAAVGEGEQAWVVAGQHREVARLIHDSFSGGYALDEWEIECPPDEDPEDVWGRIMDEASSEEDPAFTVRVAAAQDQGTFDHDLPAAAS